MDFNLNNKLNKLNVLNGAFSLIFVALFLTIFEIILYYFIIVPQLKNIVNNNLDNICKILKNNKISLSVNKIVDDILTKIYEKKNFDIDINIDINTIKNEIKNEIEKEIKQIILNEIKQLNNIEKFEQNNERKYYSEFNKPASDVLFENIIKILKKYNIEVDDNLINYIKIIIETNFDKKILNVINTLKRDEEHILKVNNSNTYVISCLIIFILLLLIVIVYNMISNARENKGVDLCTYIYSIITIFFIILFQINFYFFGQKYKYLGSFGNEELMVHFLNKF